jgi:hypothetical protein
MKKVGQKYAPRKGTIEKYKKAINDMYILKSFHKGIFCKKWNISVVLPYTLKRLGYLKGEAELFYWIKPKPTDLEIEEIINENNNSIKRYVIERKVKRINSENIMNNIKSDITHITESEAIIFLKSLGYKIMKEIKQYEEI